MNETERGSVGLGAVEQLPAAAHAILPNAMDDVSKPECLACGACCFGDGTRYVPVTGDDHARLGELSEELTVFHGNRCFMRMVDGHCAALRVEADHFVCSVYEQRPETCRELARGEAACQAEFLAKRERAVLVQLRLHGAGKRASSLNT